METSLTQAQAHAHCPSFLAIAQSNFRLAGACDGLRCRAWRFEHHQGPRVRIDKDATKAGWDCRIVLRPTGRDHHRAPVAIARTRVCAGVIDHDHLFFTESGAPMPDLKYACWRWQWTLRRLAIRYRKPYLARHTSVNWSLMVGRNPLLVAKEHGHRISTMLSVYAACGSTARSKRTSRRSATR
jgi:hypothetical protein